MTVAKSVANAGPRSGDDRTSGRSSRRCGWGGEPELQALPNRSSTLAIAARTGRPERNAGRLELFLKAVTVRPGSSEFGEFLDPRCGVVESGEQDSAMLSPPGGRSVRPRRSSIEKKGWTAAAFLGQIGPARHAAVGCMIPGIRSFTAHHPNPGSPE